MQVEQLAENVALHRGDCREIMPDLPPVDAVVSDVPYGVGYVHGAVVRERSTGKWNSKHHGERIEGDDKAFDPAHLLFAKEVLLFGANHFSSKLPDGRWLIWNKRRGIEDVKFSMSDGEMAWLNTPGATRIFHHLWFGVCRDSEIGKHNHPTQKPVALLEWCLGFIKGRLILDPYMGTGPTGVAAVNQGRGFIGIELKQKFFDIACRQVSAAINSVSRTKTG
jgi:site-specific DNA-methyltransferase (adenine-specific)